MMPMYDYNCKKCGDIQLEAKPSEIPLKECKICGTKDPQRIFAPTPSIWKTDGAFGKSDSVFHMLGEPR